MRFTVQQALFNEMARQRRTVLSPWRALIVLREASFELSPENRRWTNIPNSASWALRVLRSLEESGQVVPIRGVNHLFQALGPYAVNRTLDEREVLFEANPFAWLSHATAIEFHGLTNDRPKTIVASFEATRSGLVVPIGTREQDWDGLRPPPAGKPRTVLRSPVTWNTTRADVSRGLRIYDVAGLPCRYTTVERTILDALEAPDLAGGWINVMQAWRGAGGILNLDALVQLVELRQNNVLRQRVGFLLETLGFSTSRLQEWQDGAQRGGSSKLAPGLPYSSMISERWKLSLNVDSSVLQELTG